MLCDTTLTPFYSPCFRQIILMISLILTRYIVGTQYDTERMQICTQDT
jgi:hypothetical protein